MNTTNNGLSGQLYSATCPSCGGIRQLKRKPKAGTICKSCHNRQIAPKGWQATKAKYGEKIAVKHMQQYRLANPSNLEKKVAQTLDLMGISYDREVWFKVKNSKIVYLIDFVIHHNGQTFAIEVNGDYAHSYHAIRDKKKIARIKKAMTILVLTESEIAGEIQEKLGELLK